jgi:hypothetical protein
MPTVDISFSNCAGAMCDFTFNAVGFGAQDGKTIYVGVQQQGQMGNVTSGNDTISAGSATVMTTMSLTKNQQYNVNYFVDVDGNSLCEIGGQDLIWRESLTATGHVTIDAGYTTGFSNLGCSGLP